MGDNNLGGCWRALANGFKPVDCSIDGVLYVISIAVKAARPALVGTRMVDSLQTDICFVDELVSVVYEVGSCDCTVRDASRLITLRTGTTADADIIHSVLNTCCGIRHSMSSDSSEVVDTTEPVHETYRRAAVAKINERRDAILGCLEVECASVNVVSSSKRIKLNSRPALVDAAPIVVTEADKAIFISASPELLCALKRQTQVLRTATEDHFWKIFGRDYAQRVLCAPSVVDSTPAMQQDTDANARRVRAEAERDWDKPIDVIVPADSTMIPHRHSLYPWEFNV